MRMVGEVVKNSSEPVPVLPSPGLLVIVVESRS